MGCRTREYRVMNIEQLSPARSTSLHSNHAASGEEFSTPTAMPVSDEVTGLELGEFDIYDTMSMDFMSCCRVRLKDTNKASLCQQIRNIASFMRTRNGNFSHWRNRQTAVGCAQPRRQPRFQQSQSRQGGWSNYSRSPSFSRNRIPHTSTSGTISRSGSNFADVGDLRQTTETTVTVATLPIRAYRLQKRRNRKTKSPGS